MAPDPASVRAARIAAGHTQAQAAAAVHLARRETWADYEGGVRVMPAATWELYRLVTGQHPAWVLVAR